jgi:hypothetical protein
MNGKKHDDILDRQQAYENARLLQRTEIESKDVDGCVIYQITKTSTGCHQLWE